MHKDLEPGPCQLLNKVTKDLLLVDKIILLMIKVAKDLLLVHKDFLNSKWTLTRWNLNILKRPWMNILKRPWILMRAWLYIKEEFMDLHLHLHQVLHLFQDLLQGYQSAKHLQPGWDPIHLLQNIQQQRWHQHLLHLLYLWNLLDLMYLSILPIQPGCSPNHLLHLLNLKNLTLNTMCLQQRSLPPWGG